MQARVDRATKLIIFPPWKCETQVIIVIVIIINFELFISCMLMSKVMFPSRYGQDDGES